MVKMYSRHGHSALIVLLFVTLFAQNNAQDDKVQREMLDGMIIGADVMQEAHSFWSSAILGSMSMVDQPPIAVDDFDETFKEVPVTIPVLENDTGSFSSTTLVKLTDPSNGNVVLNADNTFTYTSNACFSGIDTFTYQICNADSSVCSVATVTVTVIPPPDANDDFETTPVNTPVTIPVLNNDTGNFDPNMTTKLTDPANGSVILNPDNTFTYTPNPGYVGVDTFTYEICNEDKTMCSTATVTITIQDVPTTPSPTFSPTASPTFSPTASPTFSPTASPTFSPTFSPTASPTFSPTASPTFSPTASPTSSPTASPTGSPSFFPTSTPSSQPSESKCCNLSPVSYDAFVTQVAIEVSGPISPGSPQQQALDWMKGETDYCECDINACKVSERYALAVFYFTTGGDSWDKCSKDTAPALCDITTTPPPGALDIGLLPEGTNPWLSPVDACEWAGIVCRDGSSNDPKVSFCVDRIEFELNNVAGTLPVEMKQFLNIRFLILERGGLSSSIPSEWGSLTELLFLDLDFNQLTGTIPDYIFTFTTMLQFDLNDNQLSGTLSPQIGSLTNLIFLQMDRNQFSGPLPSELGNLSNLRVGVFSHNDFTGEVNPVLGDNNISVLEADCGGPNPQVVCTVCTICNVD